MYINSRFSGFATTAPRLPSCSTSTKSSWHQQPTEIVRFEIESHRVQENVVRHTIILENIFTTSLKGWILTTFSVCRYCVISLRIFHTTQTMTGLKYIQSLQFETQHVLYASRECFSCPRGQGSYAEIIQAVRCLRCRTRL